MSKERTKTFFQGNLKLDAMDRSGLRRSKILGRKRVSVRVNLFAVTDIQVEPNASIRIGKVNRMIAVQIGL